MCTLGRFWESQKSNGSGDCCITTSRFIAGKLVGLYRQDASFQDHVRSRLFRKIEEYRRRLARNDMSERDFQYYAALFPASFLSELATAKRRPTLSPRSLWNTHRNPRLAKDFRDYLLQDATWNRHAGVSRCPKSTADEAVVLRQLSMGRIPAAVFTHRPKVQELMTHSFKQASELLAQGTAMVASVWRGQQHFVVVARIRGERRIWFIDPIARSRSQGVQALEGTRLYAGATPKSFGADISSWPNLYYYKLGGRLCKLIVR